MRIITGIVLSVLTVGLMGCGNFSKRSQTDLEGVFRYPIVTNPTTLDPGKVEDGDTIDLLQQVYEGLVGWSPDNKVEPRLAEKWEIKDGGTTYVFTLKQGVKFHNGKVLDSADVKWSIERACNPKLASPVAASYMGDIVGLNDVVAGKAKEVSGITCPDPQTVVIKIDKPRPYWLGKFTYFCSAILPKGAVPYDEEIKKPEQMIGTGPFKVIDYQANQQIILEAFPDYHGGAPKLKRIERRVVPEAVTRLEMYKSGQLDLLMLERQDVAGLKSDPKLSTELKYFPRPAIWYVALNQIAYPAFKDRRLRQAIAMSINRDQIVNELLGGINEVAYGVLPPSVEGYREKAAILPYDPTKAKELLKEAGYGPGGKPLPPLELNFRDSRPDIKIVAEAVARDMKDNLDVDVTLVTKEWRAYLEARNRFEIPFCHMRWAADYLDPENFISFFFATDGAENKIGYSNPEVDRLCHEANVMDDGPARMQKYQQAEDLALQDGVFIPIYFQRDVELISPRITGLRESVFGHLPHTTTEAH